MNNSVTVSHSRELSNTRVTKIPKFVASWSEVQVVWKSPSLQLIFEVRTVLTGENKNLTYKVFSNVVKLLWSLNLAINEVDNDVMFYRPFIKLVINFLKKKILLKF